MAEAGVSTAPTGLSLREGSAPNALPGPPPTACPCHPAVLLLDAVEGGTRARGGVGSGGQDEL